MSRYLHWQPIPATLPDCAGGQGATLSPRVCACACDLFPYFLSLLSSTFHLPPLPLPLHFSSHSQMTSGELKFALKLEEVLNSLPEPEYRQLVVETLMVLGLVAQSSAQSSFGETKIVVEHLINHAKHLFLVDQVNTLISYTSSSHPPPPLPTTHTHHVPAHIVSSPIFDKRNLSAACGCVLWAWFCGCGFLP